MAWPASIVPILVFGTITHGDEDGTPASGTVQFRQRYPLRDSTDQIILAPGIYEVDLDPDGQFEIELPATDAPDISPSGWTYVITVTTDAWKATYQAEVPADSIGGELDFTTLVPVDSVPAVQTAALLGHQHVGSVIRVLTDAPTIATDASLGNHYRVTLTGNRILGVPTNPTDGQRAIWEFIQDPVGSRTITPSSAFQFGTLIPSITLSTGPGKHDLMGCIYNADLTKWMVTAFAPGF